MEHLHPGVKWLFRFGSYFGLIIVFIILASFFISLGVFGLVAAIILLIVLIALVEVYVNMTYNRWKYEFTTSELKIERGIIWKIYKSIPYERIQNVEIHRGIIARMFGFSSLDIQTAGYAMYRGRGRVGAEGSLPAVSVEDAEKYREFLMKKVSGKSKSGM